MRTNENQPVNTPSWNQIPDDSGRPATAPMTPMGAPVANNLQAPLPANGFQNQPTNNPLLPDGSTNWGYNPQPDYSNEYNPYQSAPMNSYNGSGIAGGVWDEDEYGEW